MRLRLECAMLSDSLALAESVSRSRESATAPNPSSALLLLSPSPFRIAEHFQCHPQGKPRQESYIFCDITVNFRGGISLQAFMTAKACNKLYSKFRSLDLLPLRVGGYTFYSFFTSPDQPSILEIERTSIALNADDVR